MAKLIKMPFEIWTRWPKEPRIRWGSRCRTRIRNFWGKEPARRH